MKTWIFFLSVLLLHTFNPLLVFASQDLMDESERGFVALNLENCLKKVDYINRYRQKKVKYYREELKKLRTEKRKGEERFRKRRMAIREIKSRKTRTRASRVFSKDRTRWRLKIEEKYVETLKPFLYETPFSETLENQILASGSAKRVKLLGYFGGLGQKVKAARWFLTEGQNEAAAKILSRLPEFRVSLKISLKAAQNLYEAGEIYLDAHLTRKAKKQNERLGEILQSRYVHAVGKESFLNTLTPLYIAQAKHICRNSGSGYINFLVTLGTAFQYQNKLNPSTRSLVKREIKTLTDL